MKVPFLDLSLQHRALREPRSRRLTMPRVFGWAITDAQVEHAIEAINSF